ncbi:MAG: beta-propeller domain-containing protein [Nocardioides sp.]
MTDLERQWDDLPVGPAPVDAILNAARRDAARRRPERRLKRSLLGVGALGGIAAAFVAGTLVAQPGGVGLGAGSVPPGSTGIVPAAFHGELQAPESCDDLLDHYVDQAVDLVGAYGWEGPAPYYVDNFRLGSALGSVPLAAPQAMANSGTRATAELSRDTLAKTSTVTNSETGTNVQEAGVDEPDSVKTNGSMLVRLRDSTLTTYDVTGDEIDSLGRLDLGDFKDGEILLVGDTVVAIGNDGSRADRGRYGYYYDAAVPQTRVVTIDVSDPADPAIEHTVDYDAASITARQHGDDVRLVLSSGLPDLDFVQPRRGNGEESALEANVALVEETALDDWLPQVSVDGGDAEQFLDCQRVAIPRAELALGTMSVVGFDAATPGDLSSIGLGGDAPLAYESTDHLYLAASGQQSFGCFNCRVAFGGSGSGTTHVYDFELDGPAASYVGAGEVEGTVADRWAMDEYDGVLRLAVGPSSETGNFNSLVTLKADGEELVEIGRLDKIGVNEDIQSVRWFDELALLVTFRQIDPFYAIDLSDQDEPTLLGELKIPGFSDYLHPLGGMRVVGMGEGPQPVGEGRRSRGWGGQAGLFDVTDLTAPGRLDVVSYGSGSRALAGDDPRQFTWLPAQRTVLTVVSRGRAGYVSALRLGGGTMDNVMTQVEFGSDVDEVRLVPLPDDRVALVTGEDVEFFPLD